MLLQRTASRCSPAFCAAVGPCRSTAPSCERWSNCAARVPAHEELRKKIEQLERRYDAKVEIVFERNQADAGAVRQSQPQGYRSEERRVGKECRSRWSP